MKNAFAKIAAKATYNVRLKQAIKNYKDTRPDKHYKTSVIHHHFPLLYSNPNKCLGQELNWYINKSFQCEEDQVHKENQKVVLEKLKLNYSRDLYSYKHNDKGVVMSYKLENPNKDDVFPEWVENIFPKLPWFQEKPKHHMWKSKIYKHMALPVPHVETRKLKTELLLMRQTLYNNCQKISEFDKLRSEKKISQEDYDSALNDLRGEFENDLATIEDGIALWRKANEKDDLKSLNDVMKELSKKKWKEDLGDFSDSISEKDDRVKEAMLVLGLQSQK